MQEESGMYNIGLDIGTGSVGWCLTDNNGHLLKINRKGNNGRSYRNSAWGVRLFESADTAADCRIKRSTRRRYNRRRTRIIELRKIMSDMIMPIDPNFYARLDEAFLWNEDKSDKAKAPFLLFNDKEYNDKKYYEDFKTIYHLRKYLINTTNKVDARLIYLALHHMMKYRGHFLYEGQTFESIDNVEDVFVELNNLVNAYIKECEDKDGNEYNDVYREIKKCLADNEIKNKDKKELIAAMFMRADYSKKYSKEVAVAILGYEFNVGIIVGENELTGEDNKPLKTKFSDANYEEQEENISSVLGEKYSIIEALKKIYSWKVLHGILGDNTYISSAMVAKYNIHKQQLSELKQLFHKYASLDEYSDFFHKEKDKSGNDIVNYANYIKGIKRLTNKDNKNYSAKQQLYISIRKILDDRALKDETYQKILSEAVHELKTDEFADLYAEELKGDGTISGEQFVDECQVESDLELLLPATYVTGSSERMLLYRELDSLTLDKDVDAFRARLEDRFGPIPPETEELIRIVPLRRLAARLGTEKVFLKGGRMTLFFVSNPDSPYYQSQAFGKIIAYMMKYTRRCDLREQDNKRSMVVKDVTTVEEAVAVLQEIVAMQVEE